MVVEAPQALFGAPPPTAAPAASAIMPSLSQLGNRPAAPSGPGYNWLEGFAASAISGFPELIGMGPGAIGLDPDAVESWRATHPIAGFASEMVAGLGMPIGGAAIGGRMIGRALLTTAQRAGIRPAEQVLRVVASQAPAIGQMPFTSGAVAGVLEMVPYEVARVAGAAALGDEGSLGRIAQSSATDLVLGGAVLGGMHWFRSTRGADQDTLMRALVNDFDGRAAPQEQLTRLYTARANGSVAPEMLPHIEMNIGRLERDIRTAVPEQGSRFVNNLVEGADAGELNRLFNPGDSTTLTRRTFTAGDGAFPDRRTWEAAADMAQMPPGWQGVVQYPRLISANGDAAAANLTATLQRNMRNEVDGWRYVREADDGLYVMSREVQPGNHIIFKTHDPANFIKQTVFETAANRSWSYMRRVEAPLERSTIEALDQAVPGNGLSQITKLRNDITPAGIAIMSRGGTLEQYLKSLPEGLQNLSKAAQDTQRLVRDTWGFLKSKVAPGAGLYRNAPAAGSHSVVQSGVYDVYNARASMVIHGKPVVEEGQQLLVRNLRPRAGMEELLRAVPEKEFQNAIDAIANGGTLDSARTFIRGADNPEIENKLLEVLEYASKSYDDWAKEARGTGLVIGSPTKVSVHADNYGMQHLWLGNHRVEVTDELGRVIGYGSGKSSAEAFQGARNIAELNNGIVAKQSTRSSGGKADEELMRNIRELWRKPGARPVSAAEQAAVFRGGQTGPVSRKDFFELFSTKVKGEYKHIADDVSRHYLAPEITNLRKLYGDRVADDLDYQAKQLRGERGVIDRTTNKLLDKVLRPYIGEKSADTLVQWYNKLEFRNLVFTSPAYLAQQLVAPIQQVLPAVANLINGNAGQWQRFMDFVPHFENGAITGFRGMLAPLRIMSSAFRSLARPNAGEVRDLARMVSEGGISPRMIDEFAGPSSKFGQAVGEGFATGTTNAERASNAVINTLKYVSTTPAARVEELTRTYAFLAGRNVAIARGVTDAEQIYQVAKRFTNRTMYQYAAADRPKIFNGPAGSLFGLFKNWMFQNINDFSLYGHEAYRHLNIQPLMWALAGNGALAGVGGSALAGVADGLLRWYDDKGLMQHVYEAFGNGPDGNNVADAIYFGMPGFLGVSLQNQLSSPGADPQQDINFLHNFVALRRAQKIGTLSSYFYDQWRATGNPLASERTWDMINYAMGPRITYKIFSEVEDGALRSIRDGRPIVDIVNPNDRWVNALGFQPTHIARAYETATELFDRRENHRAMTARLGEAFARAIEGQDQRAMTFIIRRAVETGADVQSVMRSAATKIRQAARPVISNDFNRDPRTFELREAMGL